LNDDSNNNVNFTRNFIRHEVMSLLKSRWPNISDTLSRTAYHCNESQEIIDEFTKNDLMQCKTANNTLSIIKLISFDEKTQRQIIRLWLLEKNIVLPSEKKMQQILTTVLKAREDKTPLLKWGNFEIRRYRDELYVMSALEEFDADKKYAWDFQAPLQIPGIGTLSVNTVKGAGLKKEIQSVMVCFRQPGCKILLSGTHHSYLKNLFQEWGIPPWERGRIPLLFVDNQCVGVLLSDKWVLAEHVRARGDEEGWFVVSQV
jgi:tRNA(Ile)-lysidine synthase